MGPADTWNRMGEWLSQLGATLDQPPDAIIVVSAHWETTQVAVTSADRPSLIYDYYGFPKHTYELTYDAPGAPALAHEICEMLACGGIAATEDPDRGHDHGVFVPLKLMFPAATIPIVQVSLHQRLDPAFHLGVGEALAPLRERGVLIIGSGMSYHNMSRLMSGATLIPESDQFNHWLNQTILLDAAARTERLKNWQNAPAARQAHPREEHLLPLMVVAGAGGDDVAVTIFHDRVMGSAVSGVRFG